jgi:hypothetical protein
MKRVPRSWVQEATRRKLYTSSKPGVQNRLARHHQRPEAVSGCGKGMVFARLRLQRPGAPSSSVLVHRPQFLLLTSCYQEGSH